jgi:hypothetical protein
LNVSAEAVEKLRMRHFRYFGHNKTEHLQTTKGLKFGGFRFFDSLAMIS